MTDTFKRRMVGDIHKMNPDAKLDELESAVSALTLALYKLAGDAATQDTNALENVVWGYARVAFDYVTGTLDDDDDEELLAPAE